MRLSGGETYLYSVSLWCCRYVVLDISAPVLEQLQSRLWSLVTGLVTDDYCSVQDAFVMETLQTVLHPNLPVVRVPVTMHELHGNQSPEVHHHIRVEMVALIPQVSLHWHVFSRHCVAPIAFHKILKVQLVDHCHISASLQVLKNPVAESWNTIVSFWFESVVVHKIYLFQVIPCFLWISFNIHLVNCTPKCSLTILSLSFIVIGAKFDDWYIPSIYCDIAVIPLEVKLRLGCLLFVVLARFRKQVFCVMLIRSLVLPRLLLDLRKECHISRVCLCILH